MNKIIDNLTMRQKLEVFISMGKKSKSHSASKRKELSESVKSSFPKKALKKLWKSADDGIERLLTLGELYHNVPKSIAHVHIKVVELHDIKAPKNIKKKVRKWLNSET